MSNVKANPNRCTVCTAVASGNIVVDLVTLLLYLAFTFEMGGGGVQKCSYYRYCLFACLLLETPERKNQFSRDLDLIKKKSKMPN
jgi:hypothetical protein